MTDNEIIKALKERADFDCKHCPFIGENCDSEECETVICRNALDLINRLQADKEALIAGQETLQKALAEKIEESENQSQNFKALISDHRTLQQSFDNLKGLYDAEKENVKKAKEKCVYFAKEVQKARAETDKMTALAATWKDIAYTNADSLNNIKTEAIKEFAERLKNKSQYFIGQGFAVNVSMIDVVVKEMGG